MLKGVKEKIRMHDVGFDIIFSVYKEPMDKDETSDSDLVLVNFHFVEKKYMG